ncbi:MAG: tryptophan synthase subunit alpha [Sphaerochaetaceae bacterium]|nr:tryptophan synthase subunit alpha [Sphaerochaetaceae bacterium]
MDLICYLSNGYPSIESSIDVAKTYVEAGCDIIEIDFPSRNPYLEGDFIANRMREALKACDDYEKYMEGMIKIKKSLPQTSFILLVYENTIKEIGVDKFIKFCVDNDFMDIILCGLEDDKIKNAIIANKLRVSCYVQRKLDRTEILYAKESNGFVYLQAKTRDESEVNKTYPTLESCISYLREEGIERPIYCGVGIHTPEDALYAKKAEADAIFVGSAILKVQEDKNKLIRIIKSFKQNC